MNAIDAFLHTGIVWAWYTGLSRKLRKGRYTSVVHREYENNMNSKYKIKAAIPPRRFKLYTPINPVEDHRSRLKSLVYAGCGFAILVSFVWGIFDALFGYWELVALRMVLAVSAIIAAFMNKRGETRKALFFIFSVIFIVTFIFCAIFDIPNAQAPRSFQLYFLALGIACFLSFKGESVRLAYGTPLICFAAYYFFASSMWGIPTPYAMDDQYRIVGNWIANGLGIGLLYILFYVMQSEPMQYNSMVSELYKGLADKNFILHYQPQVGADGRICGAEALIRWNHPIRGMISPFNFIPLAEQSGFIMPLGHWVLRAACAQLVAWSTNPMTQSLTLSVNVSAQQFLQEDYVHQVLSVIERSGANPSLLKLELTESMLVNDVNDIIQKMEGLRLLGIRISLDDFGTGYSSLSYLKKLPIDQMKIDQSFVRDMLNNSQDEAIVRSIVTLALQLKLDLIAEGVETEEQRVFLKELGCSSIQGYVLSRPLEIEAFNRFFREFEAMSTWSD